MGTFNSKRRLSGGISATAVAIALCMAQPAGAQTLSTIRGEHATPGATVTATNTNTGERTAVTVGPDGTFAIVGVRPGTYRLEGAGEAREVDVPVGQTVTVDAAPVVAETQQGGEIIVRGRRDRTEVRSATVTTNVTPFQIENLPQNDRNFLNFAQLAPGVQVSPSGENKRIQAGGVSGDQVNVYIDGMSLKNAVNHGGVVGQNFSQGNPFPQLAVQEFKVDTQNFKAEYENAGSAIITAVTKTGGTGFHWNIFGQAQPGAWVREPFFERDDDTKPDYKRWQFGADLGGPILPEKLHFYAAFEGTNLTNPSAAVDLNDAVPAAIRDEFEGTFPQDFRQRLYFGKLTAFATADDTIDATVFYRDEDNVRDFGFARVAENARRLRNKAILYQADWKHRGADWLNELTLAYNKFDNDTPRVTEAPQSVLTPSVGDATAFAILGGQEFVQDDQQKGWTIKNNATFYRGDHIIKGGIKISSLKLSRLEENRELGEFFFVAPTFSSFETSVPWAVRFSVTPFETARAKNTTIGLFIQDDWTPNEHWTINAGVRWDYETNAKNEDYVTPDHVATALRNYPGWQAAGIDAEDYISTGDNRKPFKWAIQPRLGVAYDVRGDRDLIFFAGAGRYYDRPLFIASAIETMKGLYEWVTEVRFCGAAGLPACGDGMIQWSDAYRDVDALRAVVGNPSRFDLFVLNNNMKVPFSDQFNVGVRKRFGDWQTSLTVSHVRSHNLFHYVRANRFSTGWYTRVLQHDGAGNVIGCTDGGLTWVMDQAPGVDYPGCPATQALLPGWSRKLNAGSSEGEGRYTALFLQAEKPFTRESGWGVTGSLTLQRARSNVAQEVYPGTSDEVWNAGSQTAFGWQKVQGLPKWQFVGTGIVGLPWDFLFSGTLVMNSGPAFGSVLAPWNSTIVPPDGACCEVNAGGVYYPTKDIAYKTLDLRLAKTFRMAGGHEVTADFQVYNVFDWINRNYTAWGAGAGDNPPLEWDDDGTVGRARAFQAGLRYSF